MAQRNLLIGIGGSGTKVVESFVHLCSAGLGGIDPVDLVLVEVDQENGNALRTRAAVETYIELRNDLVGHEGDAAVLHLMQPHKNHPVYLGTELRFFLPDLRWGPLDGQSGVQSLDQVFARARMPAAEQLLFDSLFVRARHDGPADAQSEQGMDLREGFRGRPAIGSAIMARNATSGNDAFWNRLTEMCQTASQTDEVRIFIVGSIFGGTGAAGFPVVAKLVRDVVKDLGITPGRVTISGALMLPYFRFAVPDQTGRTIFADADDFNARAQAALHYYSEKFSQEHILDRMYLVGRKSLSEVPNSATGGNKQLNQSMITELYAGLAALREFVAPKAILSGNQRASTSRILFTGFDSEGPFDSPDLTDLGGSSMDKAKLASTLTRAARFAMMSSYIYDRHINVPDEKDRQSEWFKVLEKDLNAQNLMIASTSELRAKWIEQTEQYLRWLGSLMYDVGVTDGMMIDPRAFSAEQARHAETNQPRLLDKADWRRMRTFKPGPLSDSDIADRVSQYSSDLLGLRSCNKGRGFGKFLGRLWDASWRDVA